MVKINRIAWIVLIAFIACVPLSDVYSNSGTLEPNDSLSTSANSFLYLPFVVQENTQFPTFTPTPTATALASPTPTSTPPSPKLTATPLNPTPTSTPQLVTGNGIIADHTAIEEFEQIPDSALSAAIAQNYYQIHASTGMYISHGLDYIQGTRGESTYPPYKYDRRNWYWPAWEGTAYNFMEKLDEFVSRVAIEHNNYDVLSMKLCYQDWWMNDWQDYRDTMLQLEAAYPDKTFIWWTMPLKNDWSLIENWCSIEENFNTNIREYALNNNKILFDIADIESHDLEGNKCYSGCETMCIEYGDGHPNLDGSIRIGKGIWWLMARLSGWDGQ